MIVCDNHSVCCDLEQVYLIVGTTSVLVLPLVVTHEQDSLR